MFKTTLTNGIEIKIKFQYEGCMTICNIINMNDNSIICCGCSFCSLYDNFNKAVGRKISLSRALENNMFSKEDRKNIWNVYFSLSSPKKLGNYGRRNPRSSN